MVHSHDNLLLNDVLTHLLCPNGVMSLLYNIVLLLLYTCYPYLDKDHFYSSIIIVEEAHTQHITNISEAMQFGVYFLYRFKGL